MEVLLEHNEMLVSDKELTKNHDGSKGEIIVFCKNTGFIFVQKEGTRQEAQEMTKNTYDCPNCHSSDCAQVKFIYK